MINQKTMKRTIKYSLSGVALVALLVIASCSKKSELPQIDGYNNSNEVAASNLVAHWSFDSNTKEDISGTAPTTSVGNSFTTGTKGQALNLTQGYLLYPTIAALNSATALPSVTVSTWVKIANNGTKQSNVFGITQSTSATTDWNTGPLNVYVETGNHPVGNDTLQLHSNFATYISNTRYNGDNVNNYGVKGVDFLPFANGADKWFHYVMRYDGGESNIDLYANGVRVSNNNFRHRTYGSNVGLGNLTMTPPTQVVIGGWPNAAAGFTNSPTQTWQQLFTGGIDEIRVYSKALTDAEIGALYKLELAGR
jgi:hypothetical protein